MYFSMIKYFVYYTENFGNKISLLFIFLSNAFNKIVQSSRCQEDFEKFLFIFLTLFDKPKSQYLLLEKHL